MTYKNSDLREWTREASPRELSIVTTLYRSEPYIERFLHDCAMTLAILGITNYEFVLVDDGSPDQSVAKARALRHIYPGIRVVALARHFGHHQAAMAGLQHARGSMVFLADCDMEVLPSILHQFWQQMETSRADVVFGYEEHRKRRWKHVGNGFVGQFLHALSEVAVASDMVTERLMTRRYVDALLTLGDHDVFLAGMMAWTGFTQIGVPIAKMQRAEPSSGTLARRARLFARAMTSSSVRPLYASYWLGATALLGALLTFAVVIAHSMFGDGAAFNPLPVILAAIAGFSGLGLLCLGVLGSYVAHIHVQAKRRPIFIVKECD